MIIGVSFSLSIQGKEHYQIFKYYEDFSLASEQEEKLSHVYLLVNGKVQMVKAQDTFDYIRGDTIEIQEAYLNSLHKKPKLVNLVGFRSSRKNESADDRGLPIDTGIELIENKQQWAVDDAKSVFSIVVSSGKIVHGIIYLRRVDPQIRYVDVLVNDKKRVMREGEPLIVKESDTFHVKNVVTNLQENSEVEVKILPFTSSPIKHIRSVKYYEMHFSRKKYTFGKIPLLVETL